MWWDDGIVSHDSLRPIGSSLRQSEIASREVPTGTELLATDILFAEWKELVELLP
jgi:hypothetical protein